MEKTYNKLLIVASILATLLAISITIVINAKDTYQYAYAEELTAPNFSGSYTIPATGQSGSFDFSNSIKANVGDKIIVNGNFGNMPKSQEFLYLFFSYAKLKVTIAGNEVYSFDYDSELAEYLQTSGDLWHRIPIPVGTNSSDILLEFELVRKDYPLTIQEAHISSTMGLLNMHRQKNLVPFFLSLLIILIGIVTVIFSLVFIFTKYKAEPAVFMGLAAIASGIWFAFENDMITFFGIPPSIAYFWCLLALFIIPIPFTIYCILSYQLKLKWVLKIVAAINMSGLIVMLILQLFGVSHMVSYLRISQYLVVSAAICIVFVLLYEYKKTKQRAILNYGSRFLVLVICGVLEIANYYLKFNSGFSDIYLIGFVIFYSWQFVDIINGLVKLVTQSVKLSLYQNLAITDPLTGIRNRTAYYELAKIYNDNLDKYPSLGIGMFDLNNLKDINDLYGHNEGDKYICTCTKIICNSFPNCAVFRIGGDEFVAIFVDMKNYEIEACHNTLAKSVLAYNESNPTKLGIAFGYSYYSSEIDSELGDVLKRADVNMYLDKQELKAAAMVR